MQKISLSIPKPCHEDWNAMTPDNKDKFCGACQKTVIDFSNMSDNQLAQFFKKPAGSVCGRFHQGSIGKRNKYSTKANSMGEILFSNYMACFYVVIKIMRRKTGNNGSYTSQNYSS